MNIKSADIKSFILGSFNDSECDGVRHTKVLPWLSVVQAVEGNYGISVGNGIEENTGEGGFFIAPSGETQNITHHINPRTGAMRARWLFINAIFNESSSPDRLYGFPTVLPEKYCAEMNALFNMLFSSNSILEQYACCYRVLKILTDAGTHKAKKSDSTMFSAFEYICTSYMNEIKVADLAKYLNMSESNLYAVFKKYFGISPIAYINKMRISVAEENLKRTDESIVRIAASVGINDPIYFNKLFKREYKLSPNKYRKAYKSD